MEEAIVEGDGGASVFQGVGTPVSLSAITTAPARKIPTGMSEMDQMMGGGIVAGAVSLLGGEPGIGKSTLGLQIGKNIAQQGLKVLYVSGEESPQQIALRAQRLSAQLDQLFVLAETNMANILNTIQQEKPDLVILDSIQVVEHPKINSSAGSVNQVRYCAGELINLIKQFSSTAIIIGHITKDGMLAGPKVLEHLVDVILYFEGDRNQQYRVLRSFKNRFHHTNEIGIFEMKSTGLEAVENPSLLFVDPVSLNRPGSVIFPSVEGTRSVLIEIQSLAVSSSFGNAKRNFLGVDPARATLVIATMEKVLGLRLGVKDIFVNVIGGLKLKEPASDMAILVSLLGAIKGEVLHSKLGVMGEIGLTGEVRPVPNVDVRLRELDRMGFEYAIVPERNSAAIPKGLKVKVKLVSHLSDLIVAVSTIKS